MCGHCLRPVLFRTLSVELFAAALDVYIFLRFLCANTPPQPCLRPRPDEHGFMASPLFDKTSSRAAETQCRFVTSVAQSCQTTRFLLRQQVLLDNRRLLADWQHWQWFLNVYLDLRPV